MMYMYVHLYENTYHTMMPWINFVHHLQPPPNPPTPTKHTKGQWCGHFMIFIWSRIEYDIEQIVNLPFNWDAMTKI